MKIKFFAAVVCVLLIAGCTGMERITEISEERQTQILVRAVVREIACAVETTGDVELARSMVNIYESVRDGRPTDDAMRQLMELTDEHPTLVYAVADFAELLGVTLDDNDNVQISPEMLKAIEDGWRQGFMLCEGV